MVSTSIKILRTLSSKNLSTNELIEQTSSDKTHVEDTIRALARAGIIKRTRDTSHKQKKINQLDLLGLGLSETMSKIERYKKANEEFIQSYRKKEGWTEPEKESFYKVVEIVTSNICNVLMQIYASISNRKISPLVQAILNTIILNSLSDQLSIIRSSGKDKSMDMVHYHFTSIILEDLLDHKIGLDLISNPDIGKESQNLISSFLHLLIAPSGERNLSDYFKKHYETIIVPHVYKHWNDTMREYDTIMI